MRMPLALTVSSGSDGQSKRARRRNRSHLPQPTRQAATDTNVQPSLTAVDDVLVTPAQQALIFPIGSSTLDPISYQSA